MIEHRIVKLIKFGNSLTPTIQLSLVIIFGLVKSGIDLGLAISSHATQGPIGLALEALESSVFLLSCFVIFLYLPSPNKMLSIKTFNKVDDDLEPCKMPEPPKCAEFIVGLFVKKRYRAGILQDLEADFLKDIESGLSLGRARWRYWSSALSSAGPQMWAAVQRIGFIGAAADLAKRLLG